MGVSAKFCTCDNLDCPLHPTNHDKGCTPCISKNLNQNEIPNCFFNLVENSHLREGYSIKDFANLVINNNLETN